MPESVRNSLGMKSLRVTTLLRQSDEGLKHEVFLRLNTGGEVLKFGQQRHRAAHNSAHQITNLWIPIAIDQLVKFSIIFNAFASVGAGALRREDPGFRADDGWTASNLGVRRIVERPNGVWAEHTETNSARAVKVDRDLHTMTIEAAGRCTDRDVLVVSDRTGQIIDWSIPKVG